MSKKKFLFVCGCPRSGTTALWRLLAADGQCLLGVERYGNRYYSKGFFDPSYFEFERFFNLEKGDTFYSDLSAFNTYYDRAKSEYNDAVYFGDKIPKLYEYFDELNKNFEEVKVVFILRNIFDVASSYKKRLENVNDNWSHGVDRAIVDWNKSMRAVEKYAGVMDLLCVDYEKLFHEGVGFERIYEFLDLPVSEIARAQYAHLRARYGELEEQRTRSLNALEVKMICLDADWEMYKKLCE